MWDKMLQHWDDWGHPLRVNTEDIVQYTKLVYGKSLLLGTTTELIHLATEHADKLTNGYDWFNLPFEKGSFDVIFGDGVHVVAGPDLFDAVKPFIKPGGSFISRVFLYNNSTVQSNNFNVTKFQNLGKTFMPVQEIYNKYGDLPTTRDYNNSSDIYYFPALEDLQTPSEVFIPGYAYGEFFPIIRWIV
jgi:hypothetical protein